MTNLCRQGAWVAALGWIVSCGVAPEGDRNAAAGDGSAHESQRTAEQSGAHAVIDSIHRRFRFTDRELDAAVLLPSSAAGFEQDGSRLRPLSALGAPAGRRGIVTLPRSAVGPFSLTDEASGLSVLVSMSEATDAPAEIADGYVVYRGALAHGTDVIHRITPEGTEDFIVFETRPREATLRYGITLDASVAGLRLVSSTLEFLDGGGAPRLRVAPPYVVDARGARHAARLDVEGCSVDRRATAPWGRPVTPPGARRCELRVDWANDEVAYPALVDPGWTTTQSLAQGRFDHSATALANGLVLVAGGAIGSSSTTNTAELYDPVTETWASTGAMAVWRRTHTATRLVDGRVLVAGGRDIVNHESVETYDPTTGSFTEASPLIGRRYFHTESLLPDGRVLVTGGWNSGRLATTVLYDPVASSWTAAANLSTARYLHTATVLTDGRVLVVSGEGTSGALATTEVYDPGTNTWSPSASLGTARFWATATRLSDGRVLVAGGSAGVGAALPATEIYDPIANGWAPSGALGTARYSHRSVLLADGRVLATGGFGGGASIASAEVFEPSLGIWSPASSTSIARHWHSATKLYDGRVLVAGGAYNISSGTIAAADVYAPGAPLGVPCSDESECASEHCVDGVCCDGACGGGAIDDCQACNLAGFCEALDAGSVCREASGDCDVEEACDGASTSCPADTHVDDGEPCAGGSCLGGVCAPPGTGDGAPGVSQEVKLGSMSAPGDRPRAAFGSTSYLITHHRDADSVVFGARLTPDGTVLDPEGFEISPQDCHEHAVAYGGDHWLVVWSDIRNGNFDIYGARVAGDGTVLDPNGIAISTASKSQRHPAVAYDGTNWLVVWEDNRGNTTDIYGTRVAQNGAVLHPNGVAISTAAFEQLQPAVAAGAAGWLVVWQDRRTFSSYDIYGSRITASGSVVSPSGIALSTAWDDQLVPTVAYTGTNWLVAWTDHRDTAADIYATAVTAQVGVVTPAGVALSTMPTTEGHPSAAYDGKRVFTVWADYRAGNADAYGARISAAGSVLDATGLAVTTHPADELYATVASAPSGQLLVTYRRGPDVFARFLELAGVLGDGCSAVDQCESGHCVDGVCCDGPCGGGSALDCQACDVPGVVGTCSALPPGTVCAPALGGCDIAEACDGSSLACPPDAVASAGTTCRPAAGACDIAEMCDGQGTACPQDGFVGAGVVCRPAGDVCDVEETCPGAAAECPADAFVAAGTLCRPEAGPCDLPESCSGSGPSCPADAHMPSGTSCDDGDACTVADACAGVECAPGTPASCDDGNDCTVGTCEPHEGCVHTPLEDGSQCDDGDACTPSDTCQQGVCVPAGVVECPPADECQVTGACVPATGTCATTAKPNGTPCSAGVCTAGACTPEGSTSSTASTSSAGGDATGGGASTGAGGSQSSGPGTGGSQSSGPDEEGGCGCRVPQGAGDGRSPAVLLGLLLVLAGRRRRRARGASR